MPLTATLAKHALQAVKGHEKPHSSITDWVDILTGSNYREEDYDGIPELVDAINLQAEGPAEASRAIRKKLKHGNPHQQFRALVILKALVENGGEKFTSSFSDDRLIEAIRNLAQEPAADTRVKKKLMSVLAAWQRQFKDDPSMKRVSELYRLCKADRGFDQHIMNGILLVDQKTQDRERDDRRQKRKEEEAAKRKEREAKDEAKRKAKDKDGQRTRTRRAPFNFEQEKPNILTAIASASQACNNLVNSITLVNTQSEAIQDNERVQECLTKLKTARKPIVRYVQLVENEELIGTLLETNERIIGALEIYDMASHQSEATVPAPAETSPQAGEITKLQQKQRMEIQRTIGSRGSTQDDGPTNVHPDLQGLDFGGEDDDEGLQPPMRPSDPDSPRDEREHGLSDYSDYDSDDNPRGPPSSGSSSPGPSTRAVRRRSQQPGAHTTAKEAYADLLGSDEDLHSGEAKRGLIRQDEDPFADPFADK